jgi:hypothetical protein
MNDDGFWKTIEECHSASAGDLNLNDQLIETAIGLLSSDDAVAFYQIFQQMMDTAFTWPLWGAAYIINGGCGDDSFMDFRASLISQGRTVFESAIADPDSLAEIDIKIDDWFHEGFQYAIAEGVKKNIGGLPDRIAPLPLSPAGQKWTEANVRSFYPKLVQKLTVH